MTTTLVPAVPPNVTAAPERKPVPVNVTVVPPAFVPLLGETEARVGAGFMYEYALKSVPLSREGSVTVTFTLPAKWAGEVVVMEVELTTVVPVAAVPPKETVAPLTKLVPVMVTAVPPRVVPLLGLTPVTVGDALEVNSNAPLAGVERFLATPS